MICYNPVVCMFGRGPLVKAAGKAMENKLFEVVPWLLVLEWYHIAGSSGCTLLAFMSRILRLHAREVQ